MMVVACHQYSTIYPDKNGGADQAKWGAAFKMHAQEILPPGKPVVDAGAEKCCKRRKEVVIFRGW